MNPLQLPSLLPPRSRPHRPGPPTRPQKRAIADAVWTDLLWLMPPDRAVTITVDGGNVAGQARPRRSGAVRRVPLTGCR